RYAWACYLAFFFQAEDGIRDGHVTGVQTCALPISLFSTSGRISSRRKRAYWSERVSYSKLRFEPPPARFPGWMKMPTVTGKSPRSEERRVGKEGRARRAAMV